MFVYTIQPAVLCKRGISFVGLALMLLDVLQHCRLAKAFESLVKADDRFEVKGQVSLGLVSFRLKVTDDTEHRRIVCSLFHIGKYDKDNETKKLEAKDVLPNINRTQATERAENAVYVGHDLDL